MEIPNHTKSEKDAAQLGTKFPASLQFLGSGGAFGPSILGCRVFGFGGLGFSVWGLRV